MLNLAAVKAKQVEVVARVKAKAKDKGGGQAAKAKVRAEELRKSIMGTHLTHNPLKDQGLVDQSGAPPKDANPSIKGPENPEIQAKASDFTQDLA
jgi:hypothetical protein